MNEQKNGQLDADSNSANVEEKVNLHELEQMNVQERISAQAEENEREVENMHSDVEIPAGETARELSEEESLEVASLDREKLVERLEGLFDRKELEVAKNMVALLRIKYKEKTGELKRAALDKFLEEGGNKVDFRFTDAIEERFLSVNRKIREYHEKKREELDRVMAENLQKKQQLLEELRSLVDSDLPLKQTYDAFNRLTDKWKEIKPIARAESNNLWQSYHFLVEKFFEKVRINNELRDLDFKKNLEEKIQLCEKAEQLILEESISKASKALHDLHDRWKEIGPVMMEKKDEIWDRFKAASDAIAARRKDYYDHLAQEMEKNLLAKKALCEKAETLLSEKINAAKAWNEATDQIEELMKVWKTLGRAPQSENDAVWQRFRSALDAFFEAKKEFFRNLRDEQSNNYNVKLEICVKAENIAQNRHDFKAATDDLLKLQKQWKQVGPVPQNVSDAIWKRFRAACDTFFARKSEFYDNLRSNEATNLDSKRALIEEARNLAADSREAFLEKVKDLQRRWTEIGHVPMKEKDKIYAEFRAAIDEKFQTLGYRRESAAVREFSEIRTVEDAAKMSNREVTSLRNRISQIKDDINLWENNMGFISKARTSSVLRQEFERKIERARQDLALLEAKLKMAQEADRQENGKVSVSGSENSKSESVSEVSEQ